MRWVGFASRHLSVEMWTVTYTDRGFPLIPRSHAAINLSGSSPRCSYFSPCFNNRTRPSLALIVSSCIFPYVPLLRNLVLDIKLCSLSSRVLGRPSHQYSLSSQRSAKRPPDFGPNVPFMLANPSVFSHRS